MPEPIAPASAPMTIMISITRLVVAVDDHERGEPAVRRELLARRSSTGCSTPTARRWRQLRR